MILDSTTKRVRAFLGGAITTNQPEYIASWVDHQVAAKTQTPGNQAGALNSTTPVEVVPAPIASTQREIETLNVYNTDTVAAILNVEWYDGTDRRSWFRASLDPDWSVEWQRNGTWHVYDGDGILQGSGGSAASGITVEEADGSPSYTGITTLRLDQGDGFVLSQPGAGIARIDATGTPAPDATAQLFAWMGL